MADTKWIDRRVILSKTVDKIVISTQEAINMTSKQLYRLIRSDPITCSRHFNRRVEVFITTVLQQCKEVVGGIKEYFQVVEF